MGKGWPFLSTLILTRSLDLAGGIWMSIADAKTWIIFIWLASAFCTSTSTIAKIHRCTGGNERPEAEPPYLEQVNPASWDAWVNVTKTTCIMPDFTILPHSAPLGKQKPRSLRFVPMQKFHQNEYMTNKMWPYKLFNLWKKSQFIEIDTRTGAGAPWQKTGL